MSSVTQNTVQFCPASEGIRKRLNKAIAGMPVRTRRLLKVIPYTKSMTPNQTKVRTYRLLDSHAIRSFTYRGEQLPAGDQKWIVWSAPGDGQVLVEFTTKAKIRKTDKRLVVLRERPDEAGRALDMERLIHSASAPDYSSRIFQAQVVESEGSPLLELCSANLEWMRIPVAKIASLSRLNLKQLNAFEIDTDGSWLYWPEQDVHLGWEQFKQLSDHKAALKSKQRSADFNQRYGAAISRLRKQHGLRQTDIEGLSERQISRIESGTSRANMNALTHLAEAHRMDVSDYMKALASELTKA